MSLAWFYIPQIPSAGERLTLDERESRHAAGARRLQEGDRIVVFDGGGRAAGAIIARSGGRTIDIEVGESHVVPPLIPAIDLAVALPKGERQNIMLNMVTQLGVASITPLRCSRSVVKPSSGFAERGRRICAEACKQSRNAHLPMIHKAMDFCEFVHLKVERSDGMIIAHPRGEPVVAAMERLAVRDRIGVIIGPEGGFTEEEVIASREAGAVVCDLGRTILRTETAAITLVSCLRLGIAGR